jgi:hypothetical protein
MERQEGDDESDGREFGFLSGGPSGDGAREVQEGRR